MKRIIYTVLTSIIFLSTGSNLNAKAGDINLSLLAGPSDSFYEQNNITDANRNRYDKNSIEYKKDKLAREKLFGDMIKELGFAVLPGTPHEGRTSGFNGFTLLLDFNFVGVNNNEEYWTRTVESGKADSTLTVAELTMRKGFPGSFELSAGFSQVLGTDLSSVHAAVTWALLEGFIYVPDLSITPKAAGLSGINDLNLISGGIDFVLSKRFTAANIIKIVPSIAFSMYGVYANTGQILPALENINPIEKSEVFERPFNDGGLGKKLQFGLFAGYLRGGLKVSYAYEFDGLYSVSSGLVFRY